MTSSAALVRPFTPVRGLTAQKPGVAVLLSCMHSWNDKILKSDILAAHRCATVSQGVLVSILGMRRLVLGDGDNDCDLPSFVLGVSNSLLEIFLYLLFDRCGWLKSVRLV